MSLIDHRREHIAEYLRDESRLHGEASSISFPETGEEIAAVLETMKKEGTPVTVQGARTGIAGGAVPQGGHIMNLSGMKRIYSLRFDENNRNYLLGVEPGLTLAELRETILTKSFSTASWDKESHEALERLKNDVPYFFPPDPTEPSASLGGMVACDAKGACSFFYGGTRRYVEGLTVVLPDGSTASLRRGDGLVLGRRFSFSCDNGLVVSGELPSYTMPAIKNAAGYYTGRDMDLIDLIIGSEGTLCVVAGMFIRLVPRPPHVWGLTVFLPDEAAALDVVRSVRGDTHREGEGRMQGMKPQAIEFFDGNALRLLMEQKSCNPAFSSIRTVPEGSGSAVYIEYQGRTEDEVGEAVMALSETITAHGGSEDETWIATNAREMEPLVAFRHAVPEAVNLHIDGLRKADPSITKLGTDMAVPDERLDEVYSLYRTDLLRESLDYVIFGHIGNNHFHVNILPRGKAEYDKGRMLYRTWAERVCRMGGTIAAEHGTGKLKRDLLLLMYGVKGIDEMKEVKRAFDPGFMLNRGNLF
ncbi:MAG: FAD-binding oxidoreductase [Spirochaetales bacterium]|nr:FAD-binding oxidoreductase [Spirochaetales bacterium]